MELRLTFCQTLVRYFDFQLWRINIVLIQSLLLSQFVLVTKCVFACSKINFVMFYILLHYLDHVCPLLVNI